MTPSGRRASEQILDIADLGGRGDGIAATDAGTVYVPFALRGERVRAIVTDHRATLAEIIAPSPDRIAPACAYFTRCGGCAVQHLAEPAYRAWKRGLVETALAHRGLRCAVDPLVDAHGAGRRRTTLHVAFVGGRSRAGYMAAHSHTLHDIDRCPILAPALADAPAIAHALAGPFARRGKPLDIQLTDTQTGIDVVVRGAGPLELDARLDLPAIAEARDLARIIVDGELALVRHVPTLAVGRATVPLPPGAFLQATAAGEAALADAVGTHVRGARQIADLFCGIGPFALRLAETAAVLAVDSDTAAIDALAAATRHAAGLKPVTGKRRDLFRDPLVAAELAAFDAVVFDPPRAGAAAQSRELAASKVPVVVAVSCDPASFARDAATLIDGGYRLERVTPIDQFRYSTHVELVARFARPV